jgi:hypothetical protein
MVTGSLAKPQNDSRILDCSLATAKLSLDSGIVTGGSCGFTVQERGEKLQHHATSIELVHVDAQAKHKVDGCANQQNRRNSST